MSTRIVSQNEGRVVTHADFLTALYHDAPPDLKLELRCIHPVSHLVRTLWTAIGDDDQLHNVIQQALQFNHEGYGLYFAPCLRSEQKGSAESAALVPTLWIDVDCDDDADIREQALHRLKNFEPAPSAIIDIGGGWHSYWFLNEAFLLNSDEDSKYIEAILRGLFKALDGDESYIKSVASIMRLPDSTNTKPERGGAMVSIHCMDASRRYPLSDFEWLKVESKLSVNMPAISLNRHHSLHSERKTIWFQITGIKLLIQMLRNCITIRHLNEVCKRRLLTTIFACRFN